jgi:hypothetical protein
MGSVVNEIALRQVFCKYFGFPFQFSFHQMPQFSHPSSGSVQWRKFQGTQSHTTRRIKIKSHSEFLNGEAETPAAQPVGNILSPGFYLLELEPLRRPEVKALHHYKRHYSDVTTPVITTWSNCDTKDTHGQSWIPLLSYCRHNLLGKGGGRGVRRARVGTYCFAEGHVNTRKQEVERG